MSDISRLVEHLNPTTTPVAEPIPGRESEMVLNADGRGYVFPVTAREQFRRFLILGSTGGTYYATERAVTLDNMKALRVAVAANPQAAVAEILDVSARGLAPKNTPAILALAVIASDPNPESRKAAYEVMPVVCRTGTHLFEFVEAVNSLRGWSRGLRHAVEAWYTRHTERGSLPLQVVKYRQRGGWTHRDVLRLSHAKINPAIAQWVTGKTVDRALLPPMIQGFIQLQETTDPKAAADTITRYRLPWEAVPSTLHNEPDVWRALIPDMGYTALLRNLSRLAKLGIVKTGEIDTRAIRDMLLDANAIVKGRVHPFQIVTAMLAFKAGVGRHGEWTPVPMIVDALQDAFDLSFATVKPTGKTHAFFIDVSHSMLNPVAGLEITADRAAAILAYCTHRIEGDGIVIAFTRGAVVVKDASPRQRLDDYAMAVRRSAAPQSTNVSAAMTELLNSGVKAEMIAVYTDNEVNCGVHLATLLPRYRQATGKDTRAAFVALTPTGYSLADPMDARQLNFVGLDASMPGLLAAHANGEV